MAGDGFFINVAGFGFDVDVVRYTEKYKRRLNGMLPYMLGILQSLIYLSRTEAEIVTDSGETFNVTVTLLSACNGHPLCRGHKPCPACRLQRRIDGHMHTEENIAAGAFYIFCPNI